MKILHICPTIENKTCGIGAYTRNLCQAFREVDPSIEQAVLTGFGTIHQTLLDNRPDVVHIQLEYSFCSPQRLMLIDEYCWEYGVPLFITFHTLAPVAHNNAAPRAIKLAHTPKALDYGNFKVIPSGIPKWNGGGDLKSKLSGRELEISEKTNNYLFFGQAHHHKQLLETITLFKNQSSKNLVCVVSKPVQGDDTYYNLCREAAKDSENIYWIQNYLEDSEVVSLSAYCHTALFPYVEYGSIGISAAVKLLINNPYIRIFTTFASHFSDIPDDSGVITKVDSLEDMLKQYADLDFENFGLRRSKWIAEHSFIEVAKLHLAMYKEKSC